MNTINKIKAETKQAQNLVRAVLESDDKSRGNDLWLCILVWRSQGVNVYVDYKQLDEMLSPETITRARRKIQNEECVLLPSDPEILHRRRLKQEAYRIIHSPNGSSEYGQDWEGSHLFPSQSFIQEGLQ